LKCNHDLHLNWIYTTIPAIIFQIYFTLLLSYILILWFLDKYIFGNIQIFVLCSYFFGLLLSIFAEYNLFLADIKIPYKNIVLEHNQQQQQHDLYYHASILWTMSIIIYIINAIIIMNLEIQILALTRGFQNPRPLSRKSSGWELTDGGHNFHSIFTGTMTAKFPSLSQISLYGINHNRIPPRSIFNNKSSSSNISSSYNYRYSNNDSKEATVDNNNNSNSTRRITSKKRDSKRLSKINSSLITSLSSTPLSSSSLSSVAASSSTKVNLDTTENNISISEKQIEMSPLY